MTSSSQHRLQQVLDTLRSEIIKGKLYPGEKIYEQEISERLGVSRTPVREALRQLARDGLVTARPYKGAMVVKLNDDQVRELFEAREALEGMAARLASERVAQAQIDQVMRLLAEHQERVRNGEDIPPPIDFHGFVLSECKNHYLVDTMERLNGQLATLRIESVRSHMRRLNSSLEHMQVLHHIAKRDGDGAEQAMREHIRKVKENILKLRTES